MSFEYNSDEAKQITKIKPQFRQIPLLRPIGCLLFKPFHWVLVDSLVWWWVSAQPGRQGVKSPSTNYGNLHHYYHYTYNLLLNLLYKLPTVNFMPSVPSSSMPAHLHLYLAHLIKESLYHNQSPSTADRFCSMRWLSLTLRFYSPTFKLSNFIHNWISTDKCALTFRKAMFDISFNNNI